MRGSLFKLSPPAHAGLALSQYLKGFEPEDKRRLLEAIQKSAIPPIYKAFFECWKEAMERQGAVFIEATTATPLAIGLSNASPLENGLAIHHTYGTPYLPGSAIKGLLRRAADKYRLSKEDKEVLFGSLNNAGHIVFWDGWLEPAEKPDDKNAQPYQKDVITVHHPDYYGKRGQIWPTDFDDPNPVTFLSVKPGIKFCLALSSPDPEAQSWLHLAAELVEYGLKHLGLGGKTNAGYGYFAVKRPPKPKSEAELGGELYQTYKRRIEGINGRNAGREVNWFKEELCKHPPRVREKTLEAILKQLERYGLQRERYYQSLKNLLD